MPVVFLGTISGVGVQEKPAGESEVTLSISGGGIGSVVGTSTYPGLGCEGQLTLQEAESEYPPYVSFVETIVAGQDICTDGVIQLGAAEGMVGISFYWISADGQSTATGELFSS